MRNKLALNNFKIPLLEIVLFGIAYGMYVGKLIYYPGLFGDDYFDHEYYVNLISKNLALPKPYDCKECYHPPLYYVIAALFKKLFDLDVTWISLGFYSVYLFFSYRLLKANITYKPCFNLALVLLLFWPTGVARSSTVNNDIALCAAQITGFYYLSYWYKSSQLKPLVIALFCSALAVNFKLNGFVVLETILLSVAYKIYKSELKFATLFRKKLVAVFLLVLLLSSFPSARLAYFKSFENRNEPLIVWNVATVSPNTILSNHLKDFFVFDLKSYLTEPVIQTFTANSNSNYFWNFLLKSALLSDRSWELESIALCLCGLQLVILVYMASGLTIVVFKDKYMTKSIMPLLIFVFAQLSTLVIFRYLYPISTSQDYRYIFSLTPVIIVLYVSLIAWFNDIGWQTIEKIGLYLGYLFAALIAWLVIIEFVCS